MKEHILSIDDDPEISRIIKEILLMDGYRVSTANLAESALRVIQSDPPDLIIMDLQLEDTDGLLLVEEIRTIMPKVPILLLTGVILDPMVVRHTIAKKVSSYLAKPSSLEEIRGEVRRLLRDVSARSA